MSKAFTRESDDAPDRPVPVRPASVLPPGVKNLITPGGALRARAELETLFAEESKLRDVAAIDDAEVARRFQLLAQRVLKLQHTLQTAVVTGPPAVDEGVVRFGATVVVRERSGEETAYRVVGVDETDLDRNWVSWLSPVAKALLNARVGQRVRLKLPGGEEELEILRVSFE
jgi:transcription elongation factor GreB